MNTEEKYNLIEKYLDQKMTEAARIAFEKLVEKDADLKEELALHKQVAATLKGEKVHEFRKVLNETDKNWKSNEAAPKVKAKTINFRRIIAIAAAVLFFVLAYQFFFSGGEQLPNEQLFADNFQPYQMLLSQRDLSNEGKNALLENAISAYSKGDFQNASLAFQQLSENIPEDISFRFYRAVAELAAKNSDSAIVLFGAINAIQDHPFKEQTRWYLSLAYLQKGDSESAANLLKEIRSGQFKYAQAQQILQQMK